MLTQLLGDLVVNKQTYAELGKQFAWVMSQLKPELFLPHNRAYLRRGPTGLNAQIRECTAPGVDAAQVRLTVELTVKTLLSRLITREFNSPVSSL